ncbi:hypothetical protein N7539_006031 [Penicillium diatomitis]|uniref:Uncharacterized protein n=1 Tax=Penicillium diatomitis TaxID=2819901 RepID=A0A9W9X4X5_9EURO|nr:uncharacterized protein N7539_006031 [Penicillium diatomitis]KAJ5483831.1 hypothetical protein N7539_006031 [Penicillium diatomitis]
MKKKAERGSVTQLAVSEPDYYNLTYFTNNMHDTVSERPKTASKAAVSGLSLTVGVLGVTCAKAHGRPRLLPPVLRVGVPGAWPH